MVLNSDLRGKGGHTPVANAPTSTKEIFQRSTLISLLIADAVLIALHAILGVLFVAGAISVFPETFRIDRDWGVGEIFNYLKWIALISLSIALFFRQDAIIFVAIAIMCTVALLDDSLQLHERFSQPLVSFLDPARNLPEGTGELIFMAMEGMLVAIPLIYGWITASKLLRKQIIPLLGLFIAAFACAGAVDFLHTQAPGSSIQAGILGILEDGGEMMALSLMVSYMAGLLVKTAPRASRTYHP